MIVGVGLDLVSVRKMESSLRRDSFKKKVFTAAEIAYCGGVKNAAECYAGKFAAKEAFLKAIGCGLHEEGIRLSQIQVLGRRGGPPSITVEGEVELMLQSLGPVNVLLSVTHTSGFASAVVVLEKD